MTITMITRAAALALAVSVGAPAVLAQGFDEGSFDQGGSNAPAQTQPAPSGGSGGGFGESSFEPSGNGAPSGVAPPQGDTGTVVGGDDFPSGNVLPDVPEGGGIAPAPAPNPTPQPAPAPTPQPAPAPTPQDDVFDPQITAFETRDFGVPPQNTLRQGQFHAPTPTALPGGFLVTTGTLVKAMNNGTQMVVIDVLGSGYTLPNAYNAPAMSSAGSYNDRTQQQAAQWLRQVTGGNPDVPIVIYCSDPMCWLSYNASLRAIAAGYKQVYWYRGGVRAWQMGGLPMQPSGF